MLSRASRRRERSPQRGVRRRGSEATVPVTRPRTSRRRLRVRRCGTAPSVSAWIKDGDTCKEAFGTERDGRIHQPRRQQRVKLQHRNADERPKTIGPIGEREIQGRNNRRQGDSNHSGEKEASSGRGGNRASRLGDAIREDCHRDAGDDHAVAAQDEVRVEVAQSVRSHPKRAHS